MDGTRDSHTETPDFKVSRQAEHPWNENKSGIWGAPSVQTLRLILLESWEARKDQNWKVALGIFRHLWAQPNHHLSLLKNSSQDMLSFQHFMFGIVFLGQLSSKGGLLGQCSQKDHCQPEMTQPSSCAQVTALAARRGGGGDQARRLWKPEAEQEMLDQISFPLQLEWWCLLNIQGLGTVKQGQWRPKKKKSDKGSSHCCSVVANLTSTHEDSDLIPDLAQWVQDPVLPWLWYRPSAAALIWLPAWEPPYALGVPPPHPRKRKKSDRRGSLLGRMLTNEMGYSTDKRISDAQFRALSAKRSFWLLKPFSLCFSTFICAWIT